MSSSVTTLNNATVPVSSAGVQQPRTADFPLYRAQSAASDVFKSQWFPCYSAEYVQSQEGLKGTTLWCYSKAYNSASLLNRGFQAVTFPVRYIGSGILSAGDAVLGYVFNPMYPVNPVNGQRHFVGIPRCVEKVLGDWLFYPLITNRMTETNELLHGTNERIADRVNQVMGRLVAANTEILNPQEESTKFNYRAKTVLSSKVNAFAVPAGGMVVFTQLVKEIDAAIRSRKITSSTVEFADGSKATVDLSNVTLDDSLAALMGHEMTHVASRHSIASIMSHFVRFVVLSVGRVLLVAHIEKRTMPNGEERPDINLNDFFMKIENQIQKLFGLFGSRKNEYEADVTGTYFTQQARLNPLGALYIQEILKQQSGDFSAFLHKNFEFIFSHPYVENRKRAIFAAIQEMNPQALQGRTFWAIANNGYDFGRSSPALKYAHDHAHASTQNAAR